MTAEKSGVGRRGDAVPSREGWVLYQPLDGQPLGEENMFNLIIDGAGTAMPVTEKETELSIA